MIKFYISLCALTFCLMDVELFSHDYRYYPEAEGWLKVYPIPVKWTEARLRCFQDGAVLASPDNENLRSAMKAELNNSQTMGKHGFFTGVHATYSARKCDYFSTKGTPLSQLAIVWAPGEPDSADNSEDCLLMLRDGTFADVSCSDVYPYICYKKQNSNEAFADCGAVESGYALDSRTGKCYKFHKDVKTWANAFAACAREDAHLAIINSKTEAKVLKKLCDLHYPADCDCYVVHLGFVEWEGSHGLWMTIHGETLEEAGYDTWRAGEPNHVKGHGCNTTRCGAMYKQDGQLDDVRCHKERPYICEKEPSLQFGGQF